jgi:hypothetical protein
MPGSLSRPSWLVSSHLHGNLTVLASGNVPCFQPGLISGNSALPSPLVLVAARTFRSSPSRPSLSPFVSPPFYLNLSLFSLSLPEHPPADQRSNATTHNHHGPQFPPSSPPSNDTRRSEPGGVSAEQALEIVNGLLAMQHHVSPNSDQERRFDDLLFAYSELSEGRPGRPAPDLGDESEQGDDVSSRQSEPGAVDGDKHEGAYNDEAAAASVPAHEVPPPLLRIPSPR